MEKKLAKLKSMLAEMSDLGAIAQLMGWDQQVNMPPGGAEARGTQQATLQRLIHIKSTNPELGKLLDDLKGYAKELDLDSDEAHLIKVAARDYERDIKVPPAFMAERAKVATLAQSAWEKARETDDFSLFQPHLEKVFDLAHQFVEFFAPYDHVYDPLLDIFEPGMKTEDVKRIFAALRPQQVELIRAISEQPQVDDSFLHQDFEEQKQWDFGVDVITKFGYDWNRGRQDKAVHPFTTGFSINDVRITTRIHEDYLPSGLFSTLHEGGHAIYAQGHAPELERTPLVGGASLAIHESQSRMYENLVGRSHDFWTYFYPKLQETFPEQLGNIDLETFYKGINKVEPSLIRVEADEATYNMHIMLRLELEIAVMENEIAVKDLPDAWNARMEEYLGITPPSNRDGVLQDVHWSSGSIGYFSTYALGNLVSAQLWEKINQDIPDLSSQIQNGEFGNLLTWLRTNIHRHGRKYEPQELVERVTGSQINAEPYMRYLKQKYGEIYGL